MKPAGQSPIIRLESVFKTFFSRTGAYPALEDINLNVQPNEFTTVIGPSGCGKTTILRLCAGLIPLTSGRVVYKGKEVRDLNTDVGFVTQDSNLYPWRTLVENVEFPLEVRGVPKKKRRERAQEFIDMVGLTGFEHHYPFQLSGGMQKRAAIIRTMIYDPDIILMDEPFGPLDAQTRMILQHELLKIWQHRRKTILFITHDLVEAIALSDNVVLLTKRPGKIRQVFQIPLARPRNVFEIHTAPGFAETYHEIWQHFRVEMKIDEQ